MIYHILRLQFDIWACVVLDEAHERTTNTDMLLSLLKDVTRRRKDLKVVIMSAAFDLEKHEPKGNILLFMTSVGEIEDVWGALGNLALELPALPMCSPLSKQGQDKAILEDKSVPQTGVFSTNVLEASPTVPGIVYDVGDRRLRAGEASWIQPPRGHDYPAHCPISKASARQRVGWTQPGECDRLYAEARLGDVFEPNTPPGVHMNELTGESLRLKAIGILSIANFD
ncbi:hypothetical protein ACJZ2D_007345 [Fusarium nematophilum]